MTTNAAAAQRIISTLARFIAAQTDPRPIHQLGQLEPGCSTFDAVATIIAETQTDLLAACQNCLITLQVMQMPRMSLSVATDAELITVQIDALHAAIAKATAT